MSEADLSGGWMRDEASATESENESATQGTSYCSRKMGGKKGATATAEATTEQSVNEVTTTAIQECYKNEHSESV